MNLLDLAFGVLLVVAVIGGWRLGLITRSLSWAGMAAGTIIAAKLLPAVADGGGGGAGRGELALIAVALLIGGAFGGQALGLLLGSRLNLAVTSPGVRRLDSLGGAFAGIAGVLIVIWLVTPMAADVQGWPSATVRQSRIAQTVAEAFPPPPDATSSLRRALGDSYPQVFDGLRPAPEAGPPPASTGIGAALSAEVARSTVKIIGEACGQIQEGSGFVAGPDLVLTNAHVVAGEERTLIELLDGTRQSAAVVAFDPGRDIAVLKVPGLDRPALSLGTAKSGDIGGVYGYPGGGPLEISPFRVSERITAVGTDIYDRDRTSRDVLLLAAGLAPGDSGAALINPDGEVAGMAFAIAPDRPGVAYALTTDEIRAVLGATSSEPVDVGACTN